MLKKAIKKPAKILTESVLIEGCSVQLDTSASMRFSNASEGIPVSCSIERALSAAASGKTSTMKRDA